VLETLICQATREDGSESVSTTLNGQVRSSMIHAHTLHAHSHPPTNSPICMHARTPNNQLSPLHACATTPSTQDSQGQTALFLACALGHSDCVRFLLANGADRCIRDLHGNMALHISSMRGHIGIMFQLLSEFGMDEQQASEQPPVTAASTVNAGNSAGLTPLHLAAWCRQSAAVQVLLQHGADITARSVQEMPGAPPIPLHLACVVGTTPLHIAAARGHVDVCKILLRAYVSTFFMLRTAQPSLSLLFPIPPLSPAPL
jgi:ankyrin repeat protein